MYRIVLCVGFLSCIGVAGAQMPHIVGSWELNAAESSFPGAAPRSQIRTYLPIDDGFLLGIAVTIDPQGRAGFLQFAARPDGRDYPEYNAFTLAGLQIAGEQTTATYAETSIDDYTVEWVDKNAGVTYASGTRRVSEDGQTMTIEFEMRDPAGDAQAFRLVFDKL